MWVCICFHAWFVGLHLILLFTKYIGLVPYISCIFTSESSTSFTCQEFEQYNPNSAQVAHLYNSMGRGGFGRGMPEQVWTQICSLMNMHCFSMSLLHFGLRWRYLELELTSLMNAERFDSLFMDKLCSRLPQSKCSGQVLEVSQRLGNQIVISFFISSGFNRHKWNPPMHTIPKGTGMPQIGDYTLCFTIT